MKREQDDMTGAEFSEIDVAALKRKLDSGAAITIVDVRNGDEFAGEKGHIPGALSVPYADMPAVLESIARAKDTPIAVNCGSAGRSERAARLMAEAGFRQVSVIRGGLDAWREASFPTE